MRHPSFPVVPMTPYTAYQTLQRWIALHHAVDPSRLSELAIGRGGLPMGPFETLTGEAVTTVQILARHWETLEEERAATMGDWLLDLYPDTQAHPESLGELRAALARPVAGTSSGESATHEAEERYGMDSLVVRCERLLELLPPEDQERAHAAMIRSTHRSLGFALRDNKYQAIRRWTSTLSQWFAGSAFSLPPDMPGYFSWEQDHGSPFSHEAARLLHVVFQAVDDDQTLANVFGFLMTLPGFFTPANRLDAHGVESLRDAREALARQMLGAIRPSHEVTDFPSVDAFRALVGLNAVLVLMESADADQQRQYRQSLADLWPLVEQQAAHLTVYQTERTGLSNSRASAVVEPIRTRTDALLKQLRAWDLEQALPAPHAKPGSKPRF